jgi:anti-sigma regulatory factor (Ser/Thr protein kinase)
VSAVSLSNELFIRSEISEIRRASAWLESAGNAYGVPPDHIYRLDICLNEALANIFSHAGEAAMAGSIGINLCFTNNQDKSEFTLTVSDSGKPYNPIAAKKKPRPTTLEDTEPGGLGVLMIEKLSDTHHYNYRDGCNLLTFGVKWSKSANG